MNILWKLFERNLLECAGAQVHKCNIASKQPCLFWGLLVILKIDTAALRNWPIKGVILHELCLFWNQEKVWKKDVDALKICWSHFPAYSEAYLLNNFLSRCSSIDYIDYINNFLIKIHFNRKKDIFNRQEADFQFVILI